MGNFALRKMIREIISEYGNIAFYKADIYTTDGSRFPKYNKEKPNTPTEIDFWNDLEFETDEDIPISEDEDLSDDIH
jgi:hypothetical protein